MFLKDINDLKMSKKIAVSILIIGLVIGAFIFAGASIILSFLNLAGIYYFVKTRPSDDRKALQKIIIIAFLLRLAMSFVCVYIVYCSYLPASRIPALVGHATEVVRDYTREITNGIRLEGFLRGEFGEMPIQGAKQISVHGAGFLHLGAWSQGIINFIFGRSVFNLFIFPMLDLWSCVVVYYMANTLFGKRAAFFSSFAYAITPTVVVTCCTNIRFCVSILSFLLISLSIMMFSQKNNVKYLIVLFISLVMFIASRGKAALPLFVIIPLVLFLALNIRLKTKLFFITLFFFIIYLQRDNVFIQRKTQEIIYGIVNSQVGFANIVGGNNYRIYQDSVYQTGANAYSVIDLIKMMPMGSLKGIIHFMFAPFLWEIYNTTRLYVYTQILFWYCIIPFAFVGVIRSIFSRIAAISVPIILLYAYFIILLSLVLGNEGIATRYRDLISPFVYIFASSILCRFIPERKIIN